MVLKVRILPPPIAILISIFLSELFLWRIKRLELPKNSFKALNEKFSNNSLYTLLGLEFAIF